MRCDYCGWVNPDGAERCAKCNQVLPEPTPEVAKVEEESQPEVRSQSDTRATIVLQHTTEESNLQDILSCPECGYPLATDANECPNCGFALKAVPSTASQPVVQQRVEQQPAVQQSPMNRTIMDMGGHTAAPSRVDMTRTVMDTGIVRDSGNKRAAMKQTIRDFSAIENLETEAPQPQTVKSTAHLEPLDNFDGKATPVLFEGDSMVLRRDNVDSTNPTIDINQQAKVVCKNGEWYIQNLSQANSTYVCSSREIKLEAGDVVVIGNKRYIFQ